MARPERPLAIGASGTAALAVVRARANRDRDVHVQRIERVLSSAGIDVDVESLCAGAVKRSPVTLNFHPDRLLADGRSVAEALRDEGVYRSQYETNISSGGLSAHPGGDRDEWERRLFEDAYHVPLAPPAEWAKYGGLNLAGFVNGPHRGSGRARSC